MLRKIKGSKDGDGMNSHLKIQEGDGKQASCGRTLNSPA